MIYDNSKAAPVTIAIGNSTMAFSVINVDLWQKIIALS
jgi:hypothetical protein